MLLVNGLLYSRLLCLWSLYYLLLYPTITNTGYTNMPDFFFRTLPEDSYLSLYHLFWTSFWYLPVFFVTMYLIVTLYKSTHNRIDSSLVFLTTVVILFIEGVDYFYGNSQLHEHTNQVLGFNTLLANSINKYHPAVLYTTLVAGIATAGYARGYLGPSTEAYQHGYLIRKFHEPMYSNTLLSSFTLFLGAWWAVQEGSWGGWWNWDPSEVFGMVSMCLFVWWLHRQCRPGLLERPLVYLVVYATFIGLLYIFIQLNFDLVSHNFGTRFNLFVDPAYLYLVVLTLLAVQILSIVSLSLNLHYGFILTHTRIRIRTQSPALIHKFVRLLLVSALLYASFMVLLNDFAWKFFTVNFGNTPHAHFWIVHCIFFTLTSRFVSLTTTLVPLLVYCSYTLSTPATLLVLLPLYHVTTLRLLHLSLVSFTLLGVLSLSKVHTVWSVLPNAALFTQDYTLHTYQTQWLTAAHPLLEIVRPVLSGGYLNETSWGFIYKDTSPESRIFTHLCTGGWADQTLAIGNLILHFLVDISDVSLTPLMCIFTLLTLVLIVYIYTPCVIIF